MKLGIKLSVIVVCLLLLNGCWIHNRTNLYNLTESPISVRLPNEKQRVSVASGSGRTFYHGTDVGALEIQIKESVLKIDLIEIVQASDIYPKFHEELEKHGFLSCRYKFWCDLTHYFVVTKNLIYFRPVKKTFWGERPVPLSNWDVITTNQPPNFPLFLGSDKWKKRESG